MACSGCRKTRALVSAYRNNRNKTQASAMTKVVTPEPEIIYERVNGRLVPKIVESEE